MNLKLEKAFAVSEGPFVKGVEAVLQSLNVQRQQYHGGAFIGNHVHKVLQVFLKSSTFGLMQLDIFSHRLNTHMHYAHRLYVQHKSTHRTDWKSKCPL